MSVSWYSNFLYQFVALLICALFLLFYFKCLHFVNWIFYINYSIHFCSFFLHFIDVYYQCWLIFRIIFFLIIIIFSLILCYHFLFEIFIIFQQLFYILMFNCFFWCLSAKKSRFNGNNMFFMFNQNFVHNSEFIKIKISQIFIGKIPIN